MKRPIDTPIPIPDAAPFWVPITDDERPLYGPVTAADRLASASGFTPARFIFTRSDAARVTVVGYVRDGLAIYSTQASGQVIATVVHLPTGTGLALTRGDDLAFFVVDLIRALRPWETIAAVADIVAAAPAVIERIESVGLRLVSTSVRGADLRLWTNSQPSAARRAS